MPRRPKYREEDFPCPGTVFAARLPDGRFAAGRVLDRRFQGGAQAALIATSPWIGRELPNPEDPLIRQTLILNHHNWKNTPECVWVWDLIPEEYVVIGQIALTDEDHAVSSKAYGGWENVPIQVFLQWRWDYDRAAVLAEDEKAATAKAQARQAATEAREQYLKKLTLENLDGHDWFSKWSSDRAELPIPESRKLISDLVRSLRSQPKVTKAMATKLLRATVQGFNKLDASRQFIDTIEREEIYEVLEQVLCAARFPQLIDCVENWRDW